MALTGQFANTTTLLTLFASAAISVGVVKYVAEYKDDQEKQFAVIRTAFWLTVLCSAIIGVGTIAFSGILSTNVFKTNEYQIVYVLWGCFVMITTLGTLLSSILNGLKLIKYLTIISICATLFGLLNIVVMAHYFGVLGVLISSNFTALALFLLHLFFLNKYKWFAYKDLLKGVDKEMLKKLSAFMAMVLVSGILVPAIQLIVRDKIINDFSFTDAGHWQSVTRISDYYLGFITSVLGIYYLPRLSEITDKVELRKEIINGYKIILPAVGIMSLAIWFCRFLIIKILLTPAFEPSAILYGPQFLGDFFKIASWLLAFLMVAKGLKKTFIISEILSSVVYVGFCLFFINFYGVIGAVYGFCATYFLYLISMFIIMKKQKFI